MEIYLPIFAIILHALYFTFLKNKFINSVTFLGLFITILIEFFIYKSLKKIIINVILTFLASFLIGIDPIKSNIISGGAFYLPLDDENPLSIYIKENLILIVVLNIIFVYNPITYYLHGSMWFNGNLGLLSSNWNKSASSISIILYFIFRYGDLFLPQKRIIKYSVYILSSLLTRFINEKFPDQFVFNAFILLSFFLKIKFVIMSILNYKQLIKINKSTIWCSLDLLSYIYFIFDRIDKKQDFISDIFKYDLNTAFCIVLSKYKN